MALAPQLVRAAYENIRDDRLSDAERIHEALAAAFPDLVLERDVVCGLYALYSDSFAAGWLRFTGSEDEVASFQSWIARRNLLYVGSAD